MTPPGDDPGGATGGHGFTHYHQIEGYVIIPRVFGNTLPVTALAILLGGLVVGQLRGVVEAILSLPITAAIPAIERVWREEVPNPIPAGTI